MRPGHGLGGLDTTDMGLRLADFGRRSSAIKIQPNTIDLRTKLCGINPTNSLARTEFYCFSGTLIDQNWSISVSRCESLDLDLSRIAFQIRTFQLANNIGILVQ